MKNVKALSAEWFQIILASLTFGAILVFSAAPSLAAGSPILGDTDSGEIMPALNSSVEGINQSAIDIMNMLEASSDQLSAKNNNSTPVTPTVNIVPGTEVTGSLQGSTLILLGTNRSDNIKVIQDKSGVKVTTLTGSKTFTGTIEKIDIYGFDGDDTINVTSSVAIPARLYGGSGNDQLFANNTYGNLLDGGFDDDLLIGLNGNNVVDTLIGGDGLDSFWTTTNAIINDFSSDEAASNTMHRISQFYQPFTTNQNSSMYVALNLSGQNLPDPTDSGTIFNVSFYPLFNNGTVYYNDINQGALGDCYFLAGLASLAQANPAYGSTQPEVILQSIAPLGDGTYGVRFYRDGDVNYLRIDGDIPVNYYGKSAYTKYAGLGSGGDIWAMLLEKAYAFFRYPKSNTYSSLAGGYLDEPFAALTGLKSEYYGLSGYSDSTIYNFLQTQLSSNYAITLASKNSEPANSMIISGHAYSLQSVQNTNGKLYATVYNPWGVDGVAYDKNPKDGLLTIMISGLKQYFSYLCVSAAKIGPVWGTVSRYKSYANRLNSSFWYYFRQGSTWNWFWSNFSMPYGRF